MVPTHGSYTWFLSPCVLYICYFLLSFCLIRNLCTICVHIVPVLEIPVCTLRRVLFDDGGLCDIDDVLSLFNTWENLVLNPIYNLHAPLADRS